MSLTNQIKARKGNTGFFSGKTMMPMDDVIGTHPDGVTINEVAMGIGQNGEYVAFTCEEFPGSFTFGGSVFYDIIKKWSETETIDQINAQLSENPETVIFVKRINKRGKPYFDVEIPE